MQPPTFSTLLLIARLVCWADCRISRDVSLSPRETIPAPIVVAAAQNWDGIDGSWSSFAFQVGTPTQNVRLFISTALHQTSVVVPQGCVPSDPADCANLRGGEFQKNQSTSYVKNVANLTTNIYPLDLGANTDLGYTARAEYGFDDITIGWQGAGGPGLKNQTIAGIAAKDSYLGLFGLVPRASNFTTFNNPIPSTMQDLKSQSKIPSLSWAYTAGNRYRLAEVLGSLTLGGYDRSKFVAHDITWGFNSRDLRDLTVQINSITSSSTAGETSLLPTSTAAFLDSGTPYIWLPAESCALFEKAFNLTWDNTTKLYPISDSQHTALLAQSPNITFTLGNLTAGFSTNITLPYAAFDLTAQFPLVANTTKYFPLKRANSSQVTLGRTFFQEAYVIADYDRRNFSVSQCKWIANAAQDIVPILSPELAATLNSNGTTSGGVSSTTGSKKAPIGAIVGGVIGGLVALGVAAYLVFHFCVKPRRHAAEAATAAALAANAEKANATQQPPAGEESLFIKPELDSAQSPGPISEMEGKKNQWAVETDGNPVAIYEMPAGEVAAELRGEAPRAEMRGEGVVPEVIGSTHHRQSWSETPVEVKHPNTRWSWITSPGGGTQQHDEEKLSPIAASPGSSTMSPQSVPSPGSEGLSGIVSPQSATAPPAVGSSSIVSPQSATRPPIGRM